MIRTSKEFTRFAREGVHSAGDYTMSNGYTRSQTGMVPGVWREYFALYFLHNKH